MPVLDELVKGQLETAKEIILSLLPVERIYLFGSYAWGAPHEESDLDLFIVVSDELPGRDIDAASKVRMAFENRVTMPADILVRWKRDFDQRKMLPTLEYQIARSGILLYERVPGESKGEVLFTEDNRKIAAEWFHRAEGDLKAVRITTEQVRHCLEINFTIPGNYDNMWAWIVQQRRGYTIYCLCWMRDNVDCIWRMKRRL